MSWNLFLDDIREAKPESMTWVVARSVDAAKTYILLLGAPQFISFDHDLGEDVPSGLDLVKWIVECDMDGAIELPANFTFFVHSANPPGAANIQSLMEDYLRHKKSNGPRS